MKKKLLMSIASLVAVLAIGAGSTFALLTSNTATIANNSVTSGTASIKLCNNNAGATDNAWSNSINGFSTTGLLPGVEKELTVGQDVFVGNDNGHLDTAITSPTKCGGYHDTASTSDTSLKMVPQITAPVCDSGITPDDVNLKFIIGGQDSGYGTLTFWETNTTAYSAAIAQNATATVQMFVKLNSSFTGQNKKCVFNATFQGQQS